jgi:uncharacterized protein DUF6245
MGIKTGRSGEPASVEQLATALVCLGMYTGTNSVAEHAEESARLGAKRYRMRLANALLGAVQVEVMLAETLADGHVDEMADAHCQQLETAGANDDPEKLAGFLRWQVLRICGPLRLIAQDSGTGPIPLAAAHAADGVHRLLGVIGAGQVPSIEDAKYGIAEMEAARESLVLAISNVDILLDMLAGLLDVLDD